jgi:hypothetical protein
MNSFLERKNIRRRHRGNNKEAYSLNEEMSRDGNKSQRKLLNIYESGIIILDSLHVIDFTRFQKA